MRIEDMPGCPAGLLAAVREQAGPVDVVRLTDHRPRYHVRLRAEDGPLFAWYSAHPDDRAALQHELAVRAAVESANTRVLRCPPVLGHGDDWRLERMVEPEPLAGPATFELVVAASKELSPLDLPRRPPSSGAGATGPRRREKLERWVRLARSPLPVADVLRARRMDLSDIPRVTAHGDFHAAHVLPRDGAVWVIDWELSGRAPAGLDLMQLWASLPDQQQRDDLLAAANAAHADTDVDPRLRYVALVRRIASKVAELSRFGDRDMADAQRLLALLPEARAALS